MAETEGEDEGIEKLGKEEAERVCDTVLVGLGCAEREVETEGLLEKDGEPDVAAVWLPPPAVVLDFDCDGEKEAVPQGEGEGEVEGMPEGLADLEAEGERVEEGVPSGDRDAEGEEVSQCVLFTVTDGHSE